MSASDRSSGRAGRWHLPIALLHPASQTLRRALNIDEAMFRAQTFRAAPRDFVLWTALDEVEKTAMVLERLDGFLDDATATNDGTDSVHRTALTMVVEEEHLRARRLCEVLTQLVLFSTKDEEPYYRHFLLLEELVSANRFIEDLDEFHGAGSAWVKSTIDQTLREISVVETLVDFQHAWYAAYAPPLKSGVWRNALTREGKRLRRAIPKMTDFERMAMGTTYAEAFGRPSSSIHYTAGTDPSSAAGVGTIVAEGTKLSFVAYCVVIRCYQLLGCPEGAVIEQFVRVVASNTEASRVFSLLNVRPHIAVGDFVLARGFLGEVMEEITSIYGHRSLRIDLLAERPLPQLAGDWFRVRDVEPLFTGASLLRGVARYVGDDAAKGADLRQSVLATWEAGLRDAVKARAARNLGDPAAGQGEPPI